MRNVSWNSSQKETSGSLVYPRVKEDCPLLLCCGNHIIFYSLFSCKKSNVDISSMLDILVLLIVYFSMIDCNRRGLENKD